MKRVGPLAGVLACLLSAAPAEGGEILSRETAPAAVDGAGGMLAWSRYDSRSKTYRLVVRVRGRELLPPIRPDRRAFDARFR